MNASVLNFEKAQETYELSQTVPSLTFERTVKFITTAQKDAYRKKAIQEIRRALRKSKDF